MLQGDFLNDYQMSNVELDLLDGYDINGNSSSDSSKTGFDWGGLFNVLNNALETFKPGLTATEMQNQNAYIYHQQQQQQTQSKQGWLKALAIGVVLYFIGKKSR